MNIRSLLTLPLLFTVHLIYAQLPDLPIKNDSLYSEILKEGRRLEIVLPDGYNAQTPEKYDVLYITDGEWNTRIVSNIRQFLNIQFIPENIIEEQGVAEGGRASRQSGLQRNAVLSC